MEVTFQTLANNAVGGRHIGPGGMTGYSGRATVLSVYHEHRN